MTFVRLTRGFSDGSWDKRQLRRAMPWHQWQLGFDGVTYLSDPILARMSCQGVQGTAERVANHDPVLSLVQSITHYAKHLHHDSPHNVRQFSLYP